MTPVFIISAPSGSGKSTLVNAIRTNVDRLEFSVSYTTRMPRGSEENGREYYYTSREVFERMIERGEFLEYADVFGNYYGTAKRFLQDATGRGHDLLLDIDVQGAGQIQKNLPDAVSIFILPPNRQELEKRLRRRSSAERMTDEAVIQRRLQDSVGDLAHYREFDFVVVNDQFATALGELAAIVSGQGAHLRADRPEIAALAGRLLG